MKGRVADRWAQLRSSRPWVDHVVRAWDQMQDHNAAQYAAAITYYSFLALFPLLLLAIAITGFVLSSQTHLRAQLFQKITDNVPGGFGQTISDSVQTLINNRTGVGVIGLAGVLITGLGWVNNLRRATDAVWGLPKRAGRVVAWQISNLIVLAGLGLGVLVSMGLTIGGTQLTDQALDVVGWRHVTGMGVLVTALGIVLAVAGDLIIFSWLIVTLPGVTVTSSVTARAALLAAIGFEALKFAGTYTVAQSSHSPTAGPFAGVIAVLVWIQLVARWLLFCTAWAATATPETEPSQSESPALTEAPVPERVDGPSPTTIAAGLLGAGAAIGAGIAVWATRVRDDGPAMMGPRGPIAADSAELGWSGRAIVGDARRFRAGAARPSVRAGVRLSIPAMPIRRAWRKPQDRPASQTCQETHHASSGYPRRDPRG
ncbi:MAG: YihY/virulence factor BrkB family protein [Actinobacteria bacterium]|nr:YihY/virulence factor BrkB family protein [Actinomycetota bacterium]